MKYCKEELKIIPKRLMVFDGSQFFDPPKKEPNHDLVPKEYDNHDHIIQLEKEEVKEIEELHDDHHDSNSNGNHGHAHHNSPLDDSVGRIKQLVIGYTYYISKNEVNAFNKIYSDLVIKLSRIGEWSNETFELNILSIAPNGKASKNLKRANKAIKILANFTGSYMHKKRPSKYITTEGDMLSTQIWIQDDIIPVRTEDGNIELYGRLATDSSSSQDKCPAAALSKAIQCSHKVILERQLVGGNILFIGNYILIGHHSLQLSTTPYEPKPRYLSKKDIENTIECLFGKKNIFIIGSEENEDIDASYGRLLTNKDKKEDVAWLNSNNNSQPLFHLDLFITPAGLSDDGKKFRVVIGDPVSLLDRDETSELLRKGGLFDKTRAAINNIANRLSLEEGIEVSRIPLPLSWVDLMDESTGGTKRLWIFASYNNCLVQYVGQESEDNYVFLPKYSNSYSMEKHGYKTGAENIQNQTKKAGDWSKLKEFEYTIKKHWNHLGFKIIFLTDYLPMIIRRGALRCMIKVIDREESPLLNLAELKESETIMIS